jgi:phospholipid N-methyltransferase
MDDGRDERESGTVRRFAAEARAMWAFFQRGVQRFDTSAALFPSSRFLVRAMLRPVPWSTARCVVELGPGTGSLTREILRRMRPDATLYAIELDAPLYTALSETIRDPRLRPVHGSAVDMGAILAAHGAPKADAILSSLGLSMMPEAVRVAIVEAALETLAPGGVYTQFAYAHARYVVYNPAAQPRWSHFDARVFLERYFGPLTPVFIPANLPPAWVFEAIKPVVPDTEQGDSSERAA